jgi:hypothetical protein
MVETLDYIYAPAGMMVGAALRAYLERGAQWWWLLITRVNGAYRAGTFGSLLPYLAGKTDHIVHTIGDCVICSGLDPLLWTDTDELVDAVLADPAVRARQISDLPLLVLEPVDLATVLPYMIPEGASFDELWQGPRLTLAVENGRLVSVDIVQTKDLGGVPAY